VGEPFDLRFDDLSGGHVDGIVRSRLRDTEMAELVNFYTYGPEIIRRGGVRPVTLEAYTTRIIDFFQYKNSHGDLEIIGAGRTAFAHLDGANQVWEDTPGPVLSPTFTPGHWVQYLDIAYYVRNNLYRGTSGRMLLAGIAAPTAAPGVVDGGAGIGTMEAGKRYFTFRYRNSNTGAVSKWSPSANVTVAVGRYIAVSGLTPSVNKQVNQIEILVTTPGGAEGTYFQAGLVDNATTTFTFDKTINQLPLTQKVDTNDMPPSGLNSIAVWDERGWVASDNYVYYTPRDLDTGTALMESWPPANVVSVFPDDGHPIRALFSSSVMSNALSGGGIGRLVIGKTKGIYYLVVKDSGVGYDLKTLDGTIGCSSGHSLKGAAGYLFWFGTGKKFWISEGGGAPIDLTSYKIKNILKDIPDTEIDKVVSAIFPELSWYVSIVPQSDGISKVLAFNWQDKSWSVFTHESSIRYLASVSNSEFANLLYALTDDGFLYQYNDEDVAIDFGTTRYGSYFYTKEHNNGKPGYLHSVSGCSLMATKLPHDAGDVILGYTIEGVNRPTRTAYLYAQHPDSEGWMQFALPGRTQSGSSVGMYFYTDMATPGLRIWGYGIQGISTGQKRRER
jgi:hypothetical protein